MERQEIAIDSRAKNLVHDRTELLKDDVPAELLYPMVALSLAKDLVKAMDQLQVKKEDRLFKGE